MFHMTITEVYVTIENTAHIPFGVKTPPVRAAEKRSFPLLFGYDCTPKTGIIRGQKSPCR